MQFFFCYNVKRTKDKTKGGHFMNASNTTDITAASFFTRANHEIRNMMTLIRGSLQLIETKHPHVRAFEHWMQTMDNIRNLNRLYSFGISL